TAGERLQAEQRVGDALAFGARKPGGDDRVRLALDRRDVHRPARHDEHDAPHRTADLVDGRLVGGREIVRVAVADVADAFRVGGLADDDDADGRARGWRGRTG